MKAKFYQIISQIIANRPDEIDWDKTMQLIDRLKTERQNDQYIFTSIKEIATKGNKKVKRDSVILVDSFFKNGTISSLISLQNYVPVIFPISDFSQDAYIHCFFCQKVESWAGICHNNNCLSQNFVNWMKSLYSFRYVYAMTPETSKKFSNDFNIAHEFLQIFNNELINSKYQDKNWDELNEMHANSIDVLQRLTELESTSGDHLFLATIHYLENYCCLCIQAYESLKKKGTFNEEQLFEIEAQGMPSKNQKKIIKPDKFQQPPNTPINNSNPYRQSQINEIYSQHQSNYSKQYEAHAYPSIPSPAMPSQQINNKVNDAQSQSSLYPSISPVPKPSQQNINKVDDIQSQSQLYPSISPVPMPSQQIDNKASDAQSQSHLYPSIPLINASPQQVNNNIDDLQSPSLYLSVNPLKVDDNPYALLSNLETDKSQQFNNQNIVNDDISYILPPYAPPPEF